MPGIKRKWICLALILTTSFSQFIPMRYNGEPGMWAPTSTIDEVKYRLWFLGELEVVHEELSIRHDRLVDQYNALLADHTNLQTVASNLILVDDDIIAQERKKSAQVVPVALASAGGGVLVTLLIVFLTGLGR